MLSQRERFFSILEGKRPQDMPFIPDITDWYIFHHTQPGYARQYAPGSFIPDSAAIHACPGTMPRKFRDFTLMDFYREFDWGFHAHIYDWCEIAYFSGVQRLVEQDSCERRFCLHTPKGDLVHRDQLASDGTWCPREYFVKTVADLKILKFVIESTTYTPRFDRVGSVMQELGNCGQVDVVINRSPFGKLVHEYMGFENTVYALADAPHAVHDLLALQTEKDMAVIALAAEGPQRLVIISDHADENLLAPPHYDRYCIPFYQAATALCHAKGKFVSTHLDGNFKGHFPLLHKTGFDLLDGCTPAPMFNYEVEELAEALPANMCVFCGIPSTLFCTGLSTGKLLEFGDRIMKSLRGRGFLNIGDILPPNGNIEQVIAVGEHVKANERKLAPHPSETAMSKNVAR